MVESASSSPHQKPLPVRSSHWNCPKRQPLDCSMAKSSPDTECPFTEVVLSACLSKMLCPDWPGKNDHPHPARVLPTGQYEESRRTVVVPNGAAWEQALSTRPRAGWKQINHSGVSVCARARSSREPGTDQRRRRPSQPFNLTTIINFHRIA